MKQTNSDTENELLAARGEVGEDQGRKEDGD